jgi:hypothetical protein
VACAAKYYIRATTGINPVLIEPDLANLFPDPVGDDTSSG